MKKICTGTKKSLWKMIKLFQRGATELGDNTSGQQDVAANPLAALT